MLHAADPAVNSKSKYLNHDFVINQSWLRTSVKNKEKERRKVYNWQRQMRICVLNQLDVYGSP